MSETIIGSIYPAALIGRTPLFGSIYIPYRLIFTSERVIAFYPDPKKAFRSGLKVFKAYEYRTSKWKKLMDETDGKQVVCYGNKGISEDMLKTEEENSYGSLPYSKIGSIALKDGDYKSEFNLLFKPAELVMMRGLEFCTARSALEQVKVLLESTKLSNKVESEI